MEISTAYPILKTDKLTDFKDCRPISVLISFQRSVSKLFFASAQLCSFIETNQYITQMTQQYTAIFDNVKFENCICILTKSNWM